jgi:hypothetical protein
VSRARLPVITGSKTRAERRLKVFSRFYGFMTQQVTGKGKYSSVDGHMNSDVSKEQGNEVFA